MMDANFLKEHNARALWHPMVHPANSIQNPPKIITEATGVKIKDIDGHETVDGVGGLWNVNLGYSCTAVKEAIFAQLNKLPYYSTFRGTSNDAAIELSMMLKEFFEPEKTSRAFFTSGGSDSVETALRLSRQYHKIRANGARVKFLSLKYGYHGTHYGGASVTGNAKFREAYEPMLPGCYHITAPYPYRNPYEEDDPARLAQLCLKSMADEIAFQGPETIAAMIMEPVIGSGGVIVPHESFMPGVREICSNHGIILIADEVITAFGRTGSWTGSRHWGVTPDIICTAKAISNGYFPFGAVMLSGEIAEAFEKDKTGAGAIGHGYTYSGHPVGAAAAIACLKETFKLNIPENAAARGKELKDGLLQLQSEFDIIGDVRGVGLMCAVELVSDKVSKKPIDKNIISKVQDVTYENGAMVRISGANIIISPPLILETDDVDTIISGLRAGLQAV